MSLPQAITVSNLDHLGLVAGMIDELGIVEKINDLVGSQPGEKVSPGHAVKAMIINGLGLVSSPLYLFSKFVAPPLACVPVVAACYETLSLHTGTRCPVEHSGMIHLHLRADSCSPALDSVWYMASTLAIELVFPSPSLCPQCSSRFVFFPSRFL